MTIIRISTTLKAHTWHPYGCDCLLHCMLFLYALAIAVYQAGFEQGTGPVLLNGVRCTGTESSLLSCSHDGIGRAYCSHSQDAGVVCPPC